MPFDIEDFSSYICFVLPNRIILPRKFDVQSFQLGVNLEDLKMILKKLYNVYKKEIDSMIEFVFDLKTEFENILKALIVRTMKISEKATTFEHFLLVCSVIDAVISDLMFPNLCFRFANLSWVCLTAVYDRCYKEFFVANEGTGVTLDSSILKLKELFADKKTPEETRNVSIFGDSDMNAIMESLAHLDHETFQLSEWEEKMFEKMTDLRIYGYDQEYASTSDSTSCTGIDTEDATDCASMEEDSSKSASKPSESELSCTGNDTENATECASIDEDSSKSESKPTESHSSSPELDEEVMECIGVDEDSTSNLPESESSCTGIEAGYAIECASMDEVSSESTSKPSESESYGAGKNSEDATDCGSMDEDDSESTNKSIERGIEAKNVKQGLNIKEAWTPFKTRVCDACGMKCAKFAVLYIEKVMKRVEGESSV